MPIRARISPPSGTCSRSFTVHHQNVYRSSPAGSLSANTLRGGATLGVQDHRCLRRSKVADEQEDGGMPNRIGGFLRADEGYPPPSV